MRNQGFQNMRSPQHEARIYSPAKAIVEPDNIKLFDIVEYIVDAAEDSRLSEDFFEFVKPQLDILCTKQKLSRVEGVVLALIINGTVEGGINYREVGEFLRLSNMKMLDLLPVFYSLLDKQLIEVSRKFGKDTEYSPVDQLLKAYRDNKPYFAPSLKAENDEGLLSNIFDLVFTLWNRDIAREEYEAKIRRILNVNQRLPIMKKISEYGLTETDDYAVVLHLCSILYFDGDRDIDLRRIAFVYEEGMERNHFIHDIQRGEGTLFDCKIIGNVVTPDGLVDNTSFRLTDEAISNLLPDYKKDVKRAKRHSNFIAPEKIAKKELFCKDVQDQLDRLCGLLDDDNFRKIQKRLADNNFRKGFCCLFYGAPGTGKTAMALELARRTGRKIVRVDLSSVRNMYVGESEKNVQSIFSNYKDMLENEANASILLLNEADGLLTRRNTRGVNGVDKMENTMQNILLQNMEDFDGIMISTTNLAINMDSAFERRFLYKVEFQKPDATVRASIWHSLMPSLDDATVDIIAKKYDFSGGQIENIARKSIIDSILYGNKTISDNSLLESYCQQELIVKHTQKKKIGFC